MLEQFIQTRREHELAIARQAIERTALQQNMTVEEIRSEIHAAIMAGWNNPDPAIHERWRQIPCEGNIPSPEELILWLLKQTQNVREKGMSMDGIPGFWSS